MFKVSSFKFQEKGITLVEIVVAIFIIALFSIMAVSDFPRIQKQFALSRATYKLAQDLRKTEDLGLSGIGLKDKQGNSIAAQGYGIYINLGPNGSTTQYIIYADINNSKTYDASQSCDSSGRTTTSDCAIETIDLSQQNPSLSISDIDNIGTNFTSINFMPPGPTVNIDNISSGYSKIEITLGNGLTTRKVSVNTSGLINVEN